MMRLAVGAGLLAVAVVGVATFVPRRRLAALGDVLAAPLRLAARSPVLAAAAAWAVNLWDDAAPRAPAFDDLRPFDEF